MKIRVHSPRSSQRTVVVVDRTGATAKGPDGRVVKAEDEKRALAILRGEEEAEAGVDPVEPDVPDAPAPAPAPTTNDPGQGQEEKRIEPPAAGGGTVGSSSWYSLPQGSSGPQAEWAPPPGAEKKRKRAKKA